MVLKCSDLCKNTLLKHRMQSMHLHAFPRPNHKVLLFLLMKAQFQIFVI